jgi:ribosomal protein L1
MYPCPIKLHGLADKDLHQKLNSAVASIYFMPGNGPNYSVKIGRVSQDAKEVAKNITAALPIILGHLTCWDEIDFSCVQ